MKYTPEEIKNLTENTSVLDYFLHLEKAGKVKFERKTGHDYYFRTEANKFSVSEKRWYDYKTQNGGGIIKAVMSLENKSFFKLNSVKEEVSKNERKEFSSIFKR